MSADGKYRAKSIRLLTPDRANELGVIAESPIFVSGKLMTSGVCGSCKETFTPLVYQAGYNIKAQHYHERSFNYSDDIAIQDIVEGGIFYYVITPNTLKQRQVFALEGDTRFVGGFIAFLEPVGLKFETPPVWYHGSVGQAQEAYVKNILAYCTHKDHKDYQGVLRKFVPVKEGYVYETNERYLEPMCHEHSVLDQFESKDKRSFLRRYQFSTGELGEITFNPLMLKKD